MSETSDLPVLPTKQELHIWLTQVVSDYLGNPPETLDPARPLAEAGLDSVYALSVCSEIEETLEVPVEPTLAWDHPTIDAIVDHLHGVISTR
ncbi:acyl carrier protein [Streptomyces coacervatus]|uniref:Acyl carrier protein n=1 Tax=Streptomyces coacervatus TaxID=647381 RepID=A0ABP7IR88_9ACTN|nr:acyl carrier protein [Streptomyces coacervatus]MDF2266823.1 acyl carrier protein [Streptomyces coacervatus]